MRCFLNFTSFFFIECVYTYVILLPSYIYPLLMIADPCEPARNEFVAILGPRDLNKFFFLLFFTNFFIFYFFIFFNFLFIFWNFLLIFSSPFFFLSLCLTSISDMNSFAHILTRSRISEAISTSSSFRCFEKEIHHTFCKAKQISF